MNDKLKAYFTDRVLPAVCEVHGVTPKLLLHGGKYKTKGVTAAKEDAVRILRGTVLQNWAWARADGKVTTLICEAGLTTMRDSVSNNLPLGWHVISHPTMGRLFGGDQSTFSIIEKRMRKRGEATAVTLDGYPENCSQYRHGKEHDQRPSGQDCSDVNRVECSGDRERAMEPRRAPGRDGN